LPAAINSVSGKTLDRRGKLLTRSAVDFQSDQVRNEKSEILDLVGETTKVLPQRQITRRGVLRSAAQLNAHDIAKRRLQGQRNAVPIANRAPSRAASRVAPS